jgi:hypothetical protein
MENIQIGSTTMSIEGEETAYMQPNRRPQEFQVHHEYMRHSGINWRVTFVAVVNPGRDWSVYICASLGQHESSEGALTEENAVIACRESGNKLPEEVARALFPAVEERYRA